MQTLYKLKNQSQFQSSESTGSTGSFLASAPVELTTVNGYNDFLKSHKSKRTSTLFNDDCSRGYVMMDDKVLATITGEARDYLLELFGSP
ncbi:ADL297Wp [Eremothecium gossypii ATCC 10895]|uniref:ADL297Wp n=1 Tax=Eremothecium gossypii (strain ATCC 10895 / CBS 109.51 / FGSC 9923 / NRRL Y-1056) TaxID=284811 RepID=Q75B69_EREGS|nr:ADL297Wp [Eremothecium gossypii ATCC 10895]AAS51623.1 ADL297Wp [Eremothecium gossypii ATCC 10895]